ncbi:hypothetical protein GCM10022254_09400 [Actinomadura meridiana]|uniref:Uncharacterized protein n=1 Tax=Actinomadura meridiana TaxID=559626 RepID=A0ABP8BUB6_9ACTN
MTETPKPTVRTTRYEVSCLPPDNIDAFHFTITVEWRGGDLWAVLRYGECLGTDGKWDYEPRPSNREDDWLDAHRFDLDTALKLAQEEAPKITVNGQTVADVLRRAAS